MAQSFNAITTSIGETERIKDGKNWTEKDFERHTENYNIDRTRTALNVVFKKADGKNEREVVNNFFEQRMLELNQKKIDKVAQWNRENFGARNTKTGKLYRKKSIDKRELFPVGKYVGKGKRSMPYDTFKTLIEKGNSRGKEATSSRYRTGVLQQYVVGIGNDDEWENDPVHKAYLDVIKGTNKQQASYAADEFRRRYVEPFMTKFEKENPSLHVVQGAVHFDESHPHFQFTVLPYVPGKESGGLGSVAYTGAIKKDHPEWSKDRTETIGNFYRYEHDAIRDLVMSVDSGFDRPMILSAKRPGSHISKRVNVFNKMREDVAKQQTWLDKQKSELETRVQDNEWESYCIEQDEDKLKLNSANLIRSLNPESVVPKRGLPKSTPQKPIKTPEGFEQHLVQPLMWLVAKALKLVQKAQKWLAEYEQELTERDHEQIQHEQDIEAWDSLVTEQRQTVADTKGQYLQKINDLKKYEKVLKNKEKNVDKRQTLVDTMSQELASGIEDLPGMQETAKALRSGKLYNEHEERISLKKVINGVINKLHQNGESEAVAKKLQNKQKDDGFEL